MTTLSRRLPRIPDWLLLALLVAAGLVLRAILARPDRVVWGDEPFYLWNARNLALGRGYTFFNGVPDVYLTPLFPLLVAGAYFLLHDVELISRLAYVVLGAALTVPVYGIAREMYGRRVGLLAAALLVAYPALAAATPIWGTMTEPLYFLVAYAGLFFALRALRGGGWGAHLAAGALFGLTYLTRGEGIAYIAVVGGALALVRLFERRLLSPAVWPRLAGMLGAFVLVALPYWVYLRVETGQWMISGQAGMTFITCISLAYGDAAGFDRATWGLNAAGNEVVFFSPDIVEFSMAQYVVAHPGEFAALVVQNVRDFAGTLLSNRMFPVLLLPLLVLGWFGAAWDRRRAKGELLLAASALPVFSFLLFFVQERYIAAILPLLVIWLAAGVDRWGTWLAETWERLAGRPAAALWRGVAVAAPAILLVALFVAMLPRVATGTSVGSFRPAHREAGLWLAAHDGEEPTVMSRYPAIAFHAGARWVPTPNAEPAQIMAYARSHGADYWVLDERETASLRPQLAGVLGTDQPAGLRTLAELDDAGERLVIFEVTP